MSVSARYIAIISVIINRVGGSNISGDIYYPPFTQCVEGKFKVDKVFQKGPNVSEIFVPEVQIFQQI